MLSEIKMCAKANRMLNENDGEEKSEYGIYHFENHNVGADRILCGLFIHRLDIHKGVV